MGGSRGRGDGWEVGGSRLGEGGWEEHKGLEKLCVVRYIQSPTHIALPPPHCVQTLATVKESREQSNASQKMVIQRMVSENMSVIEEVRGSYSGGIHCRSGGLSGVE